jgi:hypothetical protein
MAWARGNESLSSWVAEKLGKIWGFFFLSHDKSVLLIFDLGEIPSSVKTVYGGVVNCPPHAPNFLGTRISKWPPFVENTGND